jgi:hypothetical protein
MQYKHPNEEADIALQEINSAKNNCGKTGAKTNYADSI